MTVARCRLDLTSRARAALFMYEEALAEKAQAETLFHDIDRQITRLSEALVGFVAEDREATLQTICRLIALRRRHATACNDAIAVARQAYAALRAIMKQAGLRGSSNIEPVSLPHAIH